MSKNITFDTDSARNTLTSLLKFHYLIFTIAMLGGVAYTVYTINSILSLPTDQAYQAQQEQVLLNSSFDTATIKRLKELNYSTSPQPVKPPTGRTSPFVE